MLVKRKAGTRAYRLKTQIELLSSNNVIQFTVKRFARNSSVNKRNLRLLKMLSLAPSYMVKKVILQRVTNRIDSREIVGVLF